VTANVRSYGRGPLAIVKHGAHARVPVHCVVSELLYDSSGTSLIGAYQLPRSVGEAGENKQSVD